MTRLGEQCLGPNAGGVALVLRATESVSFGVQAGS
jgi:hypothetical protein